jgi:predicted permease
MMGDPSDIYVPMSAQPHLVPSRPLDSPNRWWVQIMGRLAPGADETQARTSLAVLFRQVLGESNSRMDQPGIMLQEGSRGQLMLRQKLAKPFLALTIVVGIVLLIACANLAGLLLARGSARQHETAVRAAVGAGRWRLIRQSLTESLVLSLIGGSLGLVVAAWSKGALVGFLAFLPESFRFDLRADSNVLLFTLCVSVLTALIFGFLPAFRASRADPLTGLKSRSSSGVSRLRLGKVLVTVQVGLSVMLIVGAGLMIHTFANLAHVNPGFDSQKILLFRLDPGQAGYNDEKLIAFYDQTRNALSAIPDVQAVTFSGFPLASGSYSSEDVEFPGREKTPGDNWQTAILGISEGFFSMMSIPLLTGRDFNVADTASSSPVAVVNETFARRFFHDANPIGQTFILQDGRGRVFQIVGLCRDAKYNEVRAEVPPLVYLSQRQRPQGGVTFEVRSVLPPLALVPAVRKTVAALDANLPLSRIKTQEQQLDQSLAVDRLFALLGGASALLAVLLSCIGLYGLMAYNLTRRTREFGIRMALGATAVDVMRPILREAVVLAMIGLGFGVPVAFGLARFIKSQLYGIAPTDPVTFIGAGVLLVTVAVLSAWIPARRAAKVDPMEALRYE